MMSLENEFTFRSSDLPGRCHHFFAGFKTEKKFCDVTFTVGTQRIAAHRIIVAAAIPFFQDALTTEEDEITMPDVDPGVFERLIDFAYSCELKITMENVRDLLRGASQFRMDEVRDACCDFLAEGLRPENMLNLRELAVELDYLQLVEIIDHYIKERFIEIYNSEVFLSFPFSYVKELIGKDDLQVDGEEKVLEAALKWIRSSPDDRKPNLPDLLLQVRMPLMTPLHLTRIVQTEELIRTSPPNRDLIDEARNYNLFPEMRTSPCSFSTEPRHFMKTDNVNSQNDSACIYVLQKKEEFSVHLFDFTSDKWLQKYKVSYHNTLCCTVELNSKMYYFRWGDAFQYDPVENKGDYLANLTVPRIFSAAASLKNKIYVCGGQVGGEGVSNAIECFDPEKNEWSKITCMSKARWSLCAATLGGYIFAIGGRDKESVHDFVERYPSVTGGWRTMSPMLTKRYDAGAAILNGKIYVCGGKTRPSGGCTATAEMYDPLKNKWEFISPMNTTRCECSVVSCRGMLYALGGDDADGKFVYAIEVYNPETDKWTYGPALKSPDFRYFAGAIAV